MSAEPAGHAALHPAFELPSPERARDGRPLVEPLPADAADMVRVYVWQIPVRAAHWLIVLSLLARSATGIYIGHPFLIAAGPAGGRFVMGTARLIHFYAGIVFALALLSRLIWMFLGNRYARWDKLLPFGEKRRRGLWPTFKFYVFALRKPPGFAGHNPLAGIAYAMVYGLCLVMVASGLGLYALDAGVSSPIRWFTWLLAIFGGPQTARLVHHIVMWLLLGFAVHHLYSAVLMSQIEQNATMESIFTGYKFLPRADLVHSGYKYLEDPKAASERLAGKP
jgi:Ni/Fe-hydrogenase 1 B-type cytochrome subunit